jgi:transposase
MNPVVGLDVSKGESQVQAFLGKGKPYRKRRQKAATRLPTMLLNYFLENGRSSGRSMRQFAKGTGTYRFILLR